MRRVLHPGSAVQHCETRALCICRFFTLLLLYALTHQFALSMFRVIAGLTRSLVAAYPAAWLMFLILLLQGGFILPLGEHMRNATCHGCSAHG